ncbi:MAG: hypothetical protein RQ824_05125 [bacterium]|nr:hypothetical protein [bacterium]
MRSKILLVALLTCMSINTEASALKLPAGKVTIRVVDENGKPVVGMPVGIGFPVPAKTHRGIAGEAVKGFSDSNGLFEAQHETMDYVNFGADKEGYYKSRGRFNFSRSKSNQWEPWNPTVELVMRKKENPVAMYARKINVDMPVLGKEVGFDLMEGEWVAPYGKGKYPDFVFKMDSTVKSLLEFAGVLKLTFPEPFNGIQVIKEDLQYGSSFKLPRFAPESGYQDELVKDNKSIPDQPYKEDYAKDNNYTFRIRAEVEEGKLVRAMYGKIQRDIRFDPRSKRIHFTYYLNPDYTKNLEFDPKRNLFKNLPDRERVGLN